MQLKPRSCRPMVVPASVRRADPTRAAQLGAALFALILATAMVSGAGPAFGEQARAGADAPDAHALDRQIGQAVSTMLIGKHNVDVRELAVEVERGIVTLYGRVATSAEKHLALRYTADVEGVQGVVNALIVNPALD